MDLLESYHHSMLKSTQQLEGCFHRRRCDQARNDWSYHNHILQGPFLRFIRRPLSAKEASSYRLVLTAGKPKGRLTEMLLHEESEVTTATLNDSESHPSGASYIVNISGKCDGVEQILSTSLPPSLTCLMVTGHPKAEFLSQHQTLHLDPSH